MKTTPHRHIAHRRIDSDPRNSRRAESFPQSEQSYQSASLLGSCGSPARFQEPAFFEISNRYFTNEEPRGFAVDTGVFAVLILTALLPIVHGFQAVATLVHGVGLL